MDITKILQDRYSTKEFDPTATISPSQLEQIKLLLQLSPSSTNLQPWHFVLAQSKEGKEQIAKACSSVYQFNKEKVLNCSLAVVFASSTKCCKGHLQALLNQEEKDGRFPKAEFKTQNNDARTMFAEMHVYDKKDYQHWAEKQLYLNLGNFLLGVACLGLDAIAMEGLDFKTLDTEFNLRENAFTSSFVVAVGTHKNTDFNRTLPKSRLPQDTIFTVV